jgi:hypothetical protein
MDGAGRRARAEARKRTATLRRTHLSATEPDLDPVFGEAAISLVDRLTRESWAESGRPLPGYSRREIPVRFVPGRLT